MRNANYPQISKLRCDPLGRLLIFGIWGVVPTAFVSSIKMKLYLKYDLRRCVRMSYLYEDRTFGFGRLVNKPGSSQDSESDSMIKAVSLILVFQIGGVMSAIAQELPTPVQDAPCSWFAKAHGESWGTDHVVKINDQQAISGFSFIRGVLKLNNGTDAYDYLEQKCGAK
jgi:hypothetical protein